MNENRKLLGSRIRAARTHRNLSQEDLAELADIHFSYVGQVERGEKSPSVPVLTRISHSLQIPLSSLLDNLEARESRTTYNPKPIRPRLRKLFKLVQKLDDESLKLMLKFTHHLLKEKRR